MLKKKTSFFPLHLIFNVYLLVIHLVAKGQLCKGSAVIPARSIYHRVVT